MHGMSCFSSRFPLSERNPGATRHLFAWVPTVHLTLEKGELCRVGVGDKLAYERCQTTREHGMNALEHAWDALFLVAFSALGEQPGRYLHDTSLLGRLAPARLLPSHSLCGLSRSCPLQAGISFAPTALCKAPTLLLLPTVQLQCRARTSLSCGRQKKTHLTKRTTLTNCCYIFRPSAPQSLPAAEPRDRAPLLLIASPNEAPFTSSFLRIRSRFLSAKICMACTIQNRLREELL